MAKGSTLVIGFDNLSPRIKLLKTSTGQANTVSIEYIPYDENLQNTGNERQILHDSMPQIKSASSGYDNIIVVLPDYCFAIDTVNIPNLSRFKVQGALKVESEGAYKNYNELTVRYFPISSSKSYSTYGAIVVRNGIIDGIKKVFANEKLPLKEITFSSCGELNSLLGVWGKNRGKTFIFADIRENETLFAFSTKGHLSGFASLPFGHSLMASQEVVNEQMLWNHDVAELAVINAQEVAKAKKLTVAATEEEETQPVADGEEQEGPAPYEMKPDDSEEYGLTAEEAEQQRIEEEQQKLLETQPNAPKVKVFTRKAPKKLPKFMQRPEPETTEEMIEENFRSILKRILLYNDFNKQDKNLLDFEYVVLKLPQQYEFLVEKMTAEEENRIGFRCFKPEFSAEAQDNLDLVGALYTKSYNTDCSF